MIVDLEEGIFVLYLVFGYEVVEVIEYVDGMYCIVVGVDYGFWFCWGVWSVDC